ncbi:MAG TPA: hypothetical protein VMP10_00290 [Chloroflexota bacterium]|nr:hypothetical protein [Chloroflexota bacterium]
MKLTNPTPFDRRRTFAGGTPLVLKILVLTLFWSLFWPRVVAADGALEVLQVGWDGTVVSNTWSPVRLRIQGGDANGTARVEVLLLASFPHGAGPMATPVAQPVAAYGQDVALPAGVEKELTIWVPAEPNMAGVARVLVDGHAVAQQRIEFRGSQGQFVPLVGVLADSPLLARGVGQVDILLQGLPIPVGVARLSTADVPSAAERLGALNALVVQGNGASMLTNEQRQSIHSWVLKGGHLVLVGGPDAARAMTALPPDVLPVEVSGVEGAASLTTLASWANPRESTPGSGPISILTATRGSSLAGPAERSLAWRLGLGQGTVTVLAVDPTLEPLATWAGTPALLRKALEPSLPEASPDEKMWIPQMSGYDQSMRLTSVVEAMPEQAFPGWQTIALVLGGFALVVGPLMHIVLWRLDRRELVWLTVPALAVILTVGLYYAGIGRGGRDVLTNVVSHVRLNEETGQANQAVAAGFYSPTRPRLDVVLAGDIPVRALSRGSYPSFGPDGMPMPTSGEPPFRVIGGRDTLIEFDTAEWSMRTVTFDRPVRSEIGRITSRLVVDEGLIKGTVRNDTPYALEDAAVVIGQSVARIGSLAPGQTAQVLLEPRPAPNPYQGGLPLSYYLFGRSPGDVDAGGQSAGAQSVRSGASASVSSAPIAPAPVSVSRGVSVSMGPGMVFEQLEIPRDPEIQRRVRLFDAVVNVPQSGSNGQAMPLVFLAFTRDEIGGEFPSAGDHPVFHLNLLEQPLRFDLPSGPFVLPAGLIPAESGGQTGRGIGAGSDGTNFWIEVYEGSVSYLFRPPLPAGATIEELAISTRQVGPAVPTSQNHGMTTAPVTNLMPADEGVFSVYNWQAASWDALPANSELARVPAELYVGPDGLVKVQIDSGPNQMIRVIIPELTVQGRIE